MTDRREWDQAASQLDQAAEHLDQAARVITSIASKQSVVALDPFKAGLRDPQTAMRGAMPSTLEELTGMAVRIGRTGLEVHAWADNTVAYLESDVSVASDEERS